MRWQNQPSLRSLDSTPSWRRGALLLCLVTGTAHAGAPDPGAATGGERRDASAVGPASATDATRSSSNPPEDLPRRTAPLTVCFFDVNGELTPQFAAVADETNAIFREMGAELQWRHGGLGVTYGDGPGREIPVIVLERPPNPKLSPREVLGLVQRNAATPAVWIFVENIRHSLGFLRHRPDYPMLEARAAGRVIAHELVHALAPSLAHTKDGLMRGAFTAATLTSSQRPTQAQYWGAVRAALQLPKATPSPSATVRRLPSRY